MGVASTPSGPSLVHGDSGHRFFRSREQLALILVAGFAGLAVFIWAFLNAPPTGRVLSALFAIVWLVVCIRAVRAGVLIVGDQIVIRNVLRTHHLTDAEIDRFVIGRWHVLPFCCIALLKNGRRLPVTGIQRPNPALFRHSGRTDWMLGQLNDALRSGSP